MTSWFAISSSSLADEPDHDHYQALGSGQDVKVKKPFQGKAKTAYELCLETIEAGGKSSANKKWKKVFGRPVPAADTGKEAASAYSFRNTEEFIEDTYPVDVRYSMSIDCTVTQNGFRPSALRDILRNNTWLRPQRTLDFHISDCGVPEPYLIKWKVLNRGDEAERRDAVRGSILHLNRKTHRESTSFRGEHYVECYILKDGVVVARDHIDVPITTG